MISKIRTLSTALIVAALAAFASPVSAASISRARPPSSHPRAHATIIGGQSAQPGAFPWMAYVLDFRGALVGQCSGTVVAPNLVLTAGHCGEEIETGVLNDPTGYRVLTGNVDVEAAPAEPQLSTVSRVIVCRCFDRHTAVGDVSLLELSTPTSAPPVTLASPIADRRQPGSRHRGMGEDFTRPSVAGRAAAVGGYHRPTGRALRTQGAALHPLK